MTVENKGALGIFRSRYALGKDGMNGPRGFSTSEAHLTALRIVSVRTAHERMLRRVAFGDRVNMDNAFQGGGVRDQ